MWERDDSELLPSALCWEIGIVFLVLMLAFVGALV